MSLEFLELGSDNCEKVVVFIHGWKGNKDSFKTLSSILKVPNVKWLFPQAPYKMSESKEEYSWSFQNSDGTYDVKKTVESFELFLTKKVLSLVDSKNVFFVGFSQGATICYELILQLEYPWGGVFPVAGFKRDQNSFFTIHDNQQNTPIVIGHGLKDDIIPIKSSEVIYNELKYNNCDVYFEKFNGGHKISINYLKKIQSIINR